MCVRMHVPRCPQGKISALARGCQFPKSLNQNQKASRVDEANCSSVGTTIEVCLYVCVCVCVCVYMCVCVCVYVYIYIYIYIYIGWKKTVLPFFYRFSLPSVFVPIFFVNCSLGGIVFVPLFFLPPPIQFKHRITTCSFGLVSNVFNTFSDRFYTVFFDPPHWGKWATVHISFFFALGDPGWHRFCSVFLCPGQPHRGGEKKL